MQRKNIEVVAVVNQVAFANMQSFARRQTELMRQSLDEANRLMNDALGASPMEQEKLIRQAEASKIAVEKCVADVRHAAETLNSCSPHAMDVVSMRMNKSLEELRGLITLDAAA